MKVKNYLFHQFQSRFAFVTFDSEKDAEKAKDEMNGKEFEGIIFI